MDNLMENNLLNEIVKTNKPVKIDQGKIWLETNMKDCVGFVEALEEVFWFKITDGKFQSMPEANSNQLKESTWLAVRAFNEDKEIRLCREGDQFEVLTISENGDDVDSIDTHWLLFGGKPKVENGNQYMKEFQAGAYWMPETPGSAAPRIKVRQYIDYEKDTGLAKIVAERFIGLNEEK